MKDVKWNTFFITRYDLIEITKITASDVTEAVISEMIRTDNDVDDNDKNEAESSVSAGIGTKKHTKHLQGVI